MSREGFKYKVWKAARILLLSGYRRVGVRGWELKKILGPRYLDVIKVLNEELDKIGLMIKAVSKSGETLSLDNPEKLGKAIFIVVTKESPTISEVRAAGWRIDDLAILAATIMYIVSRRGEAPRKDVENMLREKFPQWKVSLNLDRFIRQEYLEEEDNILRIGWRTKAEVNLQKLLGFPLPE
ncbi:MAG TPA: hypothetical protein ENG40_02710 [Thermoprotei archaeon]|nr:hypothetical protein [Thermoprotei archaeon]